MPFALEIFNLVAISLAAKLSAMETTIQPANMIARYIITASTVIVISMAIVSPVAKLPLIAFATNLCIKYCVKKIKWNRMISKDIHDTYITRWRSSLNVILLTGESSKPSSRHTTAKLSSSL